MHTTGGPTSYPLPESSTAPPLWPPPLTFLLPAPRVHPTHHDVPRATCRPPTQVVHGTDTLAYTAAALSLMLYGFKKPIILTGES